MTEDGLDPNSSKEKYSVDKEGSRILIKLLKLLEDMEQEGDRLRDGSGEVEGPFYSNALYSYNIKLGIEDEDLPFKRGFRSRSRYRQIDILSKW